MATNLASLHQLQYAIHVHAKIDDLHAELASIFGQTSSVEETLVIVEVEEDEPELGSERTAKGPMIKMRGKGKKTKALEATAEAPVAKRRGRPPGSPKKAKGPAPAKKKGGMSAEGRARIAEAQRARWAAYAGSTASEIESLLEIRTGAGQSSYTFQVPQSSLVTPGNGPLTSRGAIQFQLSQPVPVTPGSFIPTVGGH